VLGCGGGAGSWEGSIVADGGRTLYVVIIVCVPALMVVDQYQRRSLGEDETVAEET
jgi:hypothetical protein